MVKERGAACGASGCRSRVPVDRERGKSTDVRLRQPMALSHTGRAGRTTFSSRPPCRIGVSCTTSKSARPSPVSGARQQWQAFCGKQRARGTWRSYCRCGRGRGSAGGGAWVLVCRHAGVLGCVLRAAGRRGRVPDRAERGGKVDASARGRRMGRSCRGARGAVRQAVRRRRPRAARPRGVRSRCAGVLRRPDRRRARGVRAAGEPHPPRGRSVRAAHGRVRPGGAPRPSALVVFSRHAPEAGARAGLGPLAAPPAAGRAVRPARPGIRQGAEPASGRGARSGHRGAGQLPS